ncbi:MAG: GYF domain-containing protein [Myxococcota bacterium]
MSSRPNPLAGSPERLSALADLAAETEEEGGEDPRVGGAARDLIETDDVAPPAAEAVAIRVTPFPVDAERPTASVSISAPPGDDLDTLSFSPSGPETTSAFPNASHPAVNGAGVAHEDLMPEVPISAPVHAMRPTTDEAHALFEEPTVGLDESEPTEAVVEGSGSEIVEEEIGDAFAAMFEGAQRSEAPPPAVMEHVAPAFDAPSPDSEASPMPLSSAKAEWYLAIEDEQVGPLTLEEVAERWGTGDVGPGSLCWRRGMKEWSAIETVDELAELRASTPSQAPTPAVFGPNTFALTGEMAPSIALEPEVEEVAEPISAEPEAAWRPNAASALANLAAEELGESKPAEPAPRVRPTVGAKMTALPTVNNELSRLLEGSGRAEGTASMFGLAEKSVSKVRAIPRKAETVVPAPRSHASGIERPWLKYVLMAGAAVFLLFVGAVGAYAFFGGDRRAPAAAPVAAATPPAEAAAARGPARATGVPPSEAPKPPAEGKPPVPSANASAAPVAPKSGPRAVHPAESGDTGVVSAAAPVPVAASAEVPPAAPPAALAAAVTGLEKPRSAAKVSPRASKRSSKKVRARRRVPKKRSARASSRKSSRASSSKRSTRTAARRSPPSPEEDLLAVAGSGGRRSRSARSASAPKLDETEVFRVLRKHKTQVRNCIDRHSSSGGPTGRVRVTITISPAGRVIRSAFTPAAFQNAVLGRCLASNARTWRFPAFSGKPTPVGFPVVVKE